MTDHIADYLQHINSRYKTGISREHTYRGDLQQLIEHLVPDVLVTNEPARIACGAPDYILTKKNIPVGYIEAKDIGKDLHSKDYKEQFGRYQKSLNNLIFTDYLDYHLYKDGEFITSISIAEIVNGEIKPLPNNYEQFTSILKDFASHIGQTIKSPSKLSVMMADKAKLLAQVIEKALTSDEENKEDSMLKGQMNAFKEILIHDIKPKEFADIYAQTIAYGMFAGRLHDKELDTFSRQEAAEKIPKSNPFLRNLFQYIAGYDLDHRIVWIVDELADVFRASDVAAILKNFGKSTQQHDPIIHFYETFLAEYDPKLRKERGVWYTPEPVVKFIVRAVDDILKSEFGLTQGLADTSKTKVKVNVQTHDKRSKTGLKEIEQEVHKVQVLDPAAGTGTFLAETIKHIHKKFEGQQGIWSNYVENHLIPRINGFELLMASYAMAHLKLDLLLTKTGYKPSKEQRFRVYLTNSLEEHHKDTGTLFANWLSSEANEANHIKRDTPVMCVIGNPPYSGESSNKSSWIMNLMNSYKIEPETNLKLKETNSKFINSDEYKFVRFAQHLVEKNGDGIVAYICPNGFLDNPTFRGMRWNLLKTFDEIIILDLHGNSKRNEVAKEGGKDENVFYIMQGVSINFFIKRNKKREQKFATVRSFDLFGTRKFKYEFLNLNSISDIPFKIIPPVHPMYYMVERDYELQKVYSRGFSVKELFKVGTIGVLTKNDSVAIQQKKSELQNILNDFKDLSENDLKVKYSIKKDSRDWKLSSAKSDVITQSDATDISKLNYRPFDSRYTFISGKGKGFVAYPQNKIRDHISNDNLALICVRQLASLPFNHVFITDIISEQCFISNRTKEGGVVFPLYLNQDGFMSTNTTRIPNFSKNILDQIESVLSLKLIEESSDKFNNFTPIDLLDYIYASLHSPRYRDKYKEFLKTDFPIIPYPKDQNRFWELVKLGGELRQIHLLESPKVDNNITTYPNDGSNVITRKLSKTDWEITNEEKQVGRIWINDDQYFDSIPLVAWEFYIGGYQPAQKWLKDRREQELSFDDISHYRKIIVALNETNRLMQEIDKIEIE